MYQPPGVPMDTQDPNSAAAAAAMAASIAASAAYLNQYYPQGAAYPTTTPGPSPSAAVAPGPIVAPGALSYYAFASAGPSVPGQKHENVAPPPAEPTVTPKVAERAIKKLVTAELKNAGFDRAEPMAVKQLELEVQACAYSNPPTQPQSC